MMQRKNITAMGLLNFLNLALDDFNIRKGFADQGLVLPPSEDPAVKESALEFIKTEEQRLKVQVQYLNLLGEISFNPDADDEVDKVMKALNLTNVPVDALTTASTEDAAAGIHKKHARFFSEMPVAAVNKKAKVVEVQVTDDMTVGDLYTQLTGRRPT